ncbi:MAG: anhydro-N-acetylmuramic acid kinase [Chloroflexi bacterium]|nr:anhydro-N-acetylmuramic acid kinase [Chloroflexota bacterium]
MSPVSTPTSDLLMVGLMSGTSLDAMDAALVSVHGSGPRLSLALHAFSSTPLPSALRKRILAACDPRSTIPTQLLCELHREIGELSAQAVQTLLAQSATPSKTVDAIAAHGQTIWHQGRSHADHPACTLQLGEPSIIAERTGITTVANFRARDIAAGGQGAPLASYLDWALFRHPTRGRALQNLGGIGNVTILPAGCSPEDVIAFDTGPANMLIDAIVRRATSGTQTFDRDGRLAAQGRVQQDLVAMVLSHPFFLLAPPRTGGREEFGEQLADRLWQHSIECGYTPPDVIASCTYATARSIASSYHQFVLPHTSLSECFVSGGGTHNPVLLDWLIRLLAPITVQPLSTLGFAPQHKEAAAFAVLGAETLRNVPGSLPRATGATHATVLGVICPGENFSSLMHRLYEEITAP